jgi:colanic acid biosynthesis glycosyl transferase WcaI
MNKTITLITSNFFPEDTAIGLYTTQLSEYLIKKGFQVTIITGFPYYPNWKIFKEYNSKPFFYEETHNNIRIIRFKQYVPSKISLISRVLMILTFNFGLLINFFKVRKSGLVISIIPFTTNCVFGFLFSKIYGSKFWIHIQDFEFDLLIDSGIGNKNSLFSKLFFKLLLSFERKLLNSADVVSSISNSMMQKVFQKSKANDVFYFPNWVSVENINPVTAKSHTFFDKSKYNLLYSGNIGEKQDWDFFINFCKNIKDDDNIEITIVGKGAYYKNLVNRSACFNFIKFKDVVPYHELSDLLCSADMHFLFQKSNVVDSVMPSKLLGMMASAKPCVVTGNKDSEVNTILSESNGGKYLFSNDPKEAYECVINLKSNEELSKKMGCAAREYVKDKFSENAVLDSFVTKINTLFYEK